MAAAAQWNFAARLVERLGPHSGFIDAATGRTIGPEQLPRLIAAYGASLISAGLNAGDRVLIGCALSPSSALVYLGAIYAGLVAVPVDERTLISSAPMLVEATGAKAVWSEAGLPRDEARKVSVLSLEGDLARDVAEVMPPAACAAS
ncbi:MAG: AMP-binding protein, partial [Terracidiphilus sp.]